MSLITKLHLKFKGEIKKWLWTLSDIKTSGHKTVFTRPMEKICHSQIGKIKDKNTCYARENLNQKVIYTFSISWDKVAKCWKLYIFYLDIDIVETTGHTMYLIYAAKNQRGKVPRIMDYEKMFILLRNFRGKWYWMSATYSIDCLLCIITFYSNPLKNNQKQIYSGILFGCRSWKVYRSV